ncbi:hypothetical protein AKO1_002707, partial [Acrasis kona]
TFLLILLCVIIHTRACRKLIRLVYPISSIWYYMIAYTIICFAATYLASWHKKLQLEEQKYKNEMNRNTKIPFTQAEVISMGLDEKQIKMHLRERDFQSMLQPVPIVREVETRPVQKIRRRGELDEVDYNIIFGDRNASNRRDQYSMLLDQVGARQMQPIMQQQIMSPQRSPRTPSQFGSPPYIDLSQQYQQQYQEPQQQYQPQNVPQQPLVTPLKTTRTRHVPFVSPPKQVEKPVQKDPNVILEELGLTPFVVNYCIDNLKVWFVLQILKPTLVQIEHLNSVFQKEKLDLYNCYHILDAFPTTDHLNDAANIPQPTDQRMTVGYILQRLRDPRQFPISHNRINIEQYLNPKWNRRYLIQRISELSNDPYLTKFQWDAGGDFKSSPFKAPEKWDERDDLPTDTSIFMHLFRKWLDLSLPADRIYGKSTFSVKYYVDKGDPTLNREVLTNGTFLILQKRSPPHYVVYSKGQTYDCPAGRNNMFHAIVLFVHLIDECNKGYIEGINIHDEPIRLPKAP